MLKCKTIGRHNLRKFVLLRSYDDLMGNSFIHHHLTYIIFFIETGGSHLSKYYTYRAGSGLNGRNARFNAENMDIDYRK